MFELIVNWCIRQFPDCATDHVFSIAQRMFNVAESDPEIWYSRSMWAIYDATKR